MLWWIFGGYLVHNQSMKESSTQACQLSQVWFVFAKLVQLVLHQHGIAPTFLKLAFDRRGRFLFLLYLLRE